MLFQWSMYYLSFAPLWLSVLFIDIMSILDGATNISVEWISIILIPIIFLISQYIMRRRLKPSRIGSQKYTLEKAEEEKFLTAEFLFSYIFPLFAFDFTTWRGMVLFALFFVIFGGLCVHHNYFCANVMLDVQKYTIYSCEITDINSVCFQKKIISKRDLRLYIGDEVYAKGINNDYFFDCSG